MKILALELSSARGGLAWLDDDVDVAWEWPNDRKNSGAFFNYLRDVQRRFGSAEKIIVGLGPGSYAGTRIAISAAIGLSLSGETTSVPCQESAGRDRGRASILLRGLPSIFAIDCNSDEYCVIGDARRQSFFFAHIRRGELLEGPTLHSEAELRGKLNATADNISIFASEMLPQFERAVVRYPSAAKLARLAQDANRSFVLPPLEPMYLREPHITTARSTSTP